MSWIEKEKICDAVRILNEAFNYGVVSIEVDHKTHAQFKQIVKEENYLTFNPDYVEFITVYGIIIRKQKVKYGTKQTID